MLGNPRGKRGEDVNAGIAAEHVAIGKRNDVALE